MAQHQDHGNEFDMDRLLSADAEGLRQQTRAQVSAGLKLRVIESLASLHSPSFAPMRRWNVALAAAAILVLVGVVATRVPRYLPSHSNDAPAIASAPQTPQVQVASVLPQKVALSTARVRTRQTSIKVAKSARPTIAPFPTPSPLSPEEHALLQIARAEPQERLLIYTQQQQMTEDYLRRVQEFKARIANQGDANER